MSTGAVAHPLVTYSRMIKLSHSIFAMPFALAAAALAASTASRMRPSASGSRLRKSLSSRRAPYRSPAASSPPGATSTPPSATVWAKTSTPKPSRSCRAAPARAPRMAVSRALGDAELAEQAVHAALDLPDDALLLPAGADAIHEPFDRAPPLLVGHLPSADEVIHDALCTLPGE